MSDLKNKVSIAKDKLLGETKETVGKVSGNEELELKGKIQSSKADFRKKLDIGDKVEELKEGIAAKINDSIDKLKKHN
jgi:uncharacterized protein YjbJ (UPF0337 family)